MSNFASDSALLMAVKAAFPNVQVQCIPAHAGYVLAVRYDADSAMPDATLAFHYGPDNQGSVRDAVFELAQLFQELRLSVADRLTWNGALQRAYDRHVAMAIQLGHVSPFDV